MMVHHVVTIALMTLSYTYNLTRVGCVVMVIMDCCDLIFPVSSILDMYTGPGSTDNW